MGPASMTAFIPSTIRCLKQNLIQTTITLIAALGLSAQADELSSYRCYEIEGAKIIAEDGTYLGSLDDSYKSDSIFNEYSDHGKTYSDNSLWNEYSDHGKTYSSNSAFNEYASEPPVLLKDGEVIGRLTVKEYTFDAINPTTVGKDCGWTMNRPGFTGDSKS
jgi:hypothetical protein